MSETIKPPAFRERFALATFQDGGVVVDLVTGTYARLNRSATAICQVLIMTNDVASARSLVAERLSLEDGEAAHAVDEIVTALHTPGPRRIRPDPFTYARAPDGGGYVLLSNGSPRLWIAPDGFTVRRDSADRSSVSQIFDYLRVVAPRILFLQGAFVLHGAACHGSNGAFAVCGDSGAGKTTTARAFDAAGARLFAEDMLVIASLSPLTVHFGGEEAIRRWASEAADRLFRTSQVEATDLRAALEGAPVDIAEIWFIAADQRTEDTDRILPQRLSPTDGALAVMASIFLGATSLAEWRKFLGVASTIAASTVLLQAAPMPLGLDRLRKAAELYTQNSA